MTWPNNMRHKSQTKKQKPDSNNDNNIIIVLYVLFCVTVQLQKARALLNGTHAYIFISIVLFCSLYCIHAC